MTRLKLLLWVCGMLYLFNISEVAEAQDFTTEQRGDVQLDEWFMMGTHTWMTKHLGIDTQYEMRAKKDGQAGGQNANSLRDHIHKGGQEGMTLDEKMEKIIDFFKTHKDTMTRLNEDRAMKIADRFWCSGGYGISTVITDQDGILDLLIDHPDPAPNGGQVITFDFLTKKEGKKGQTPTQPIYISHFGPFNIGGAWGEILTLFDRFKKELQTAELQTLWEEATKAVKAKRAAFNALPEVSRTLEIKTHLENAETALMACRIAEFKRLIVQTKDSQDLTIRPWPLQVQQLYRLVPEIQRNCEIAKTKVSRAIIHAVPKVGPPQKLQNTAWGKNKRETGDDSKQTVNTMVRLGAQLELLDSDPDSEFIITKVEFKEVHSGGEETHTWDVERKVLVTDPNTEGSKLTAEVQVDGEMKPSEVETAVKERLINIVLSPRGGEL